MISDVHRKAGRALALGLSLAALISRPAWAGPGADEEVALLFTRVRALLGQQVLQAGGEEPSPFTCGFGMFADLHAGLRQFHEDDRRTALGLLARPVLPESVLSPTGRFRLHYTTTGGDAVDPTDDDGNGTPDFVDETARAYDASYHLIVNEMGYRPAPKDDLGGGPEYDVYMESITGYGATIPETSVPGTQGAQTSYILMDNNFREGIFYTKGLDAMRVTAAHEFFHMVQLAYYYRDVDRFYLEASSTWMEDVAYPEVNDYFQYLGHFLGHPNLSFDEQNGRHEYGLAVWNHMLTAKYGREIIRDIWERIEYSTALESIRSALISAGSDFPREIWEFGVWNLFTGERAIPGQYYPEGDLYPTIGISTTFSFSVDTTLFLRTKHLSNNYVSVSYGADREVVLLSTNLHESPECAAQDPSCELRIELTQSNFGAFFTPINSLLNLRFTVEQAARWRGTVIEGPADDVSILSVNPVEPSLMNREEGLLVSYPNPFHPEQQGILTTTYLLKEPSELTIQILNANGRLVFSKDIGKRREGLGFFNWNGTDDEGEVVASGVYIIRLKSSRFVKSGKFALVRR